MNFSLKEQNLTGFLKEIYDAGKISKVINYRNSGNFKIGKKVLGKDFIFIAGPCSVESEQMILDSANSVKRAGCDALRAGAYKPCTYPVNQEVNGWQEGTRERGLEFLKSKIESGLQIVSKL